MPRWFWQRRRRIACGVLLAAIATAWYQDALSAYPNRKADRCLKIDHLDDAEWWLDLSEMCLDQNPRTSLLRARIARKKGDAELFTDYLRSFIDQGGSPDRAEKENILAAAAAGQSPALMGQLADLLIAQDIDTDEVCCAFANGFLVANDLQQAFVLIHEWKQSFPEDPRPHYANGRVQDHLSNQAVAEQEYLLALDRVPDHYPSAFALGRLLLENNHPAEALDCFRICLPMKHSAAARIGEAKCLRQLGEIDQAKQILDNVVSLPLEELRTAYERVSETIEGRPDCAELGSLLVSTGEAEEAINYLTMALDANPRDLDVRYSRGIALRETGRVEEGLAEIASVSAAREELTRADRIVDSIDPTRPQVPERIQIGEIYLNHGSFKTSEFWLLSALSHDHENPRALELLIRLYTDWEELNPEFREQQASNYRRQLQSLAPDSSDTIESGKKTDEAQQ